MSELVINRTVQYDVGDFWPAGFPPKEEMEPFGYDRRRGDLYRLPGGMANINSGERFDVVVLCERIWRMGEVEGVETLSEVRLIFR